MNNINEKDKAFATEFSTFMNGRMYSAEKTGRELANDHRYGYVSADEMESIEVETGVPEEGKVRI